MGYRPQMRMRQSGLSCSFDSRLVNIYLLFSIRNVPLVILTVDGNGQVHVDKMAILEKREKTIALNTRLISGGI
jgi:hypothetical protein